MNTFVWEDGTIIERPYVEINGTKYYVQDGSVSGGTPVTSTNLNEMQNILNGNIPIPNIVADGNEVKLPFKIDGRDVYAKRLSMTFGSSNSNKAHGLTNFNLYNHIELSLKNNIWRLPVVEISSDYIYYYSTGADLGTGYVTLYYTYNS